MPSKDGGSHYKTPLGLIVAGVVFLFIHGAQNPGLSGKREPAPLYIAYMFLGLGALGFAIVSVSTVAGFAKRRHEESQARRSRDEQTRRDRDAQKRRDDARTSCEFLYHQHAHGLQDRLPRAVFEDFVARLLNDRQSPDVVEQRAGELRGLIQKHADKIDPPERKMTLANLAQWLLSEKKMIEETALSDVDKQLLLAQLEERYVRLQEKYFRSVQP